NAGYSSRITDPGLKDLSSPLAVQELLSILHRLDAPVLAISVFNDAVPLLCVALREASSNLSTKRIFVGGPGVVGIAGTLLQAAPIIEGVVVGEGETVFPLLLQSPEATKAIPGVFRRTADGWEGYGRTPRENLSVIKPPDWQWCQGRGYRAIPLST